MKRFTRKKFKLKNMFKIKINNYTRRLKSSKNIYNYKRKIQSKKIKLHNKFKGYNKQIYEDYVLACKKRNNKLSNDDKLKAKINSICYLSPNNRPSSLDNYKLDNNFNSTRHVVYYNNTNCIIAFRGTAIKNKKDLQDLHMDGFILLNQMTKNKYFRNADETLKKIINKYSTHTIELTGHSLGGSICLYLLNSHNNKIHKSTIFNPGISIIPYKNNIIKTYANNSKNYFVIKLGDPISNKIIKYNPVNLTCLPTTNYKKVIDNHSINNFIDL